MQSRSDPAKLSVHSMSVVFLSYVVFHVKCFVSFLKWASHYARWPTYQHDPQEASWICSVYNTYICVSLLWHLAFSHIQSGVVRVTQVLHKTVVST